MNEPTPLPHTTSTPPASSTRRAAAGAVALLTLLAACGGDDDAESADTSAPAEEAAEEATDQSTDASAGTSEGGGSGHWSAAELCALFAADDVAAIVGADVEATPGLDDPDWSVCQWKDGAGDALASATHRDHAGGELSASFEPVDLAGADQAAFAGEAAVDLAGQDLALLVVVGDQIVTLGVNGTDAAAETLLTDAAATWVAAQTGS